jgi:hypothetical protein
MSKFVSKTTYEVKEGDKYGNFTVIAEIEPRYKGNRRFRRVRYTCICGKESVIDLNALTNDNQRPISCGCFAKKLLSERSK